MIANIPDHVRPEQVVTFDVYRHDALDGDLHRGLQAIYDRAPDIFYTPCNGGHWVATRMDIITRITADTMHFSTQMQNIPKTQGDYKLIPLNLDPPESTAYRAILMKLFSASAIKELEPVLRSWARRLVAEVAAHGRCDLVPIGARFPVSVFMELMGLPLDRIDEFRGMVAAYFGYLEPEQRVALQARIAAEMDTAIADRRQRPEDDIISHLIGAELHGRPLTDGELQSICFTLFLAGLDTVANAIGFAFQHLARDPALQALLKASPGRSSDFVEEALRRSTIANTVRLVKQDMALEGAVLKEGEMVLCALPAAGLDARCASQPMRFDVDRKDREHIAFSPGPHMCIGHYLARSEMRIFVEEWLAQIPSFRRVDDSLSRYRPGTVMQLRNLMLEWECA